MRRSRIDPALLRHAGTWVGLVLLLALGAPISVQELPEAPTAKPGDVSCVDAEAHPPVNTGDAVAELILVELKEREALD